MAALNKIIHYTHKVKGHMKNLLRGYGNRSIHYLSCEDGMAGCVHLTIKLYTLNMGCLVYQINSIKLFLVVDSWEGMGVTEISPLWLRGRLLSDFRVGKQH